MQGRVERARRAPVQERVNKVPHGHCINLVDLEHLEALPAPSSGAPSFLASQPLPLCGLPAGYKPKKLGIQSSCSQACPPHASSRCWPSSSPLSPLGVEPLFPRTHSVVCLAVLVPGKFCSAFSSLVRPVFRRSPPWRFQPSLLSPPELIGFPLYAFAL